MVGQLLALALTLGCGREDVELAHRAERASGGAGSGGAGGDSAQPPTEDCSAALPQDLLTPRPPMGWNGFYTFGCSPALNEAKVKENAAALIDSGMLTAGYQFVNLDLCWERPRDANGQRVFEPERLPGGLDGLSQFLHQRGLLLGVAVPITDCRNTPGAQGFEETDAAQFSAAGVDYVKYVACSAQAPDEAIVAPLQQALRDSTRPMVFSLAAPPFSEWMSRRAQLWRTSASGAAGWDSVVQAIDATTPLAAYARPGAFNDPEMLLVGNAGLSEAEQRAQISVWSILSAPLLAGNDLSSMSDSTRSLLTNGEVLALDQDPLGLQGAEVRRDGDVQILAKPLADCGARGVVLWNRGDGDAEVDLRWQDLWLEPGEVRVRDLWAQTDVVATRPSLSVVVPSHDAVALRVTGREPALPRGETYLSDLAWTYAVNGYGPAELDTSNGEFLAGDGVAMRLRGAAHEKGLGVHPPSLLRYRLGQRCSRFLADVGIDDETGGLGSVHFEVWADGQLLFASGLVTGSSPARRVDVDLTGKRDLRLFVDTAGDTYSYDHSDWASARLICRPDP